MWTSGLFDGSRARVWVAAIGMGLLTVSTLQLQAGQARAALWIDALRGEPVEQDEMLADLQQARVIYLGEYHTIPRHHQLETELLQALSRRGAQVVLAMEQFEGAVQPALDQFNSGALDLSGLVKETNLAKRWSGYTNYLALITAARELKVPILALNARAELIHAIARHGLSGLTPEQRGQLPKALTTNDPPYERLLDQTLAVHMAFNPAQLRPVFEAQVGRDETMAEHLAEFLGSPAGQGRIALVICGQGHCQFGLGTPDRVAARMPKVVQRVVLFSQSGDLELTPQERKQARDIEISHQFLRDLGRAAADYFHVVEERP